MSAEPYYADDLVTLYAGRWQDNPEWLTADVLVTDPPYGIAYKSGSRRETLADSIDGDQDTSERDEALMAWGDRPALVFGSWRRERPAGTRAKLIWDTKGALGMGDLSVPWKPSHQEVYVLGSGFIGRRDSDVLTHAPVQSMATNGRLHPHQKPLSLMTELIAKTVGTVADPFAGSGSTLVAAKMLGRRAIGCESDPRYLPIIAERLLQGSLSFGEAS